MNQTIDLTQMGKDAKAAAHLMAHASTEQKNKALKGIAEGLKNQRKEILAANQNILRKRRPLECPKPCWTGFLFKAIAWTGS